MVRLSPPPTTPLHHRNRSEERTNGGNKLASSHHGCGGSIDLQRVQNGSIKFTQPGPVAEYTSITYDDGNTGKPLELDTACTWVIDVPADGTVRLEGVSVDGGSEVTVLCGASGERRGLVAGERALLLGCGTAVVTWRALGPTSSQHNIQLFYTGQEAVWNSSERQGPWMGVSSVQRSSESFNGDGTPRNETKSMLTQGGRRGEGGEMGAGGEASLQPSESFVGDLELDRIPGSTPTLQGLSTTSSPQAGLTVAGHADREVPLLPEEEPDNRKDTSGTAQLADHVTTGALRLALSLTSSPLAGPGEPGRTPTPQRYTLAGLTEQSGAPGRRSTRSIRVWRGEWGPGITSDPQGLKVTSEVTPSQTERGLTSVPVTVESIELLLQVILEESSSDLTTSIEEDTTAWVATYLQRAPGFQDLQGVWSSGRAVQSVVVFKTSGALAWLGVSGADSLLERTGLAQAVREGRSFRGSKVTNITVGGLQEDVCLWLFRCSAGFECVSGPSHMAICSSVCHTDYCHNHGICTHHPHQPPLCHYRRFNHFDELSGRFWGRSINGSADSLDNPAFTRSDELLHLRALDRTCCYHDDTLSLGSTCPSNGTHLNTVYTHGSQYGWEVSEVSLAECVVDSGKASDLSVCSWPIEPIQWTPFPLLKQLSSSHRTTPVRAPRPRSYCEGMELVEVEKSWTA
ncbi:hypothetical protein J4Q44_G00294250 [Coregonus suidteri]|uniref:CUB domain-containing protein n=1 Tax=Coregonus suidteri TaxID=861788 RepID=A0AAN8QTJ7_9TELE